MPDFWNDSQQRPNFYNDVAIGESERKRMIEDLYRTIARENMVNLNRSQDQSSYLNLTPGARTARQRGINYMGNLAAEQGTADVNKYVTGHNKAMMQWLLGMAQQQEQFKSVQSQKEMGMWLDFLNKAGHTAATWGQTPTG